MLVSRSSTDNSNIIKMQTDPLKDAMQKELASIKDELENLYRVAYKRIPELEQRDLRVRGAIAAMEGKTQQEIDDIIASADMIKAKRIKEALAAVNGDTSTTGTEEKGARKAYGSSGEKRIFFTDDQILKFAEFLMDLGTTCKSKKIYEWALERGIIDIKDHLHAKSFAIRLLNTANRDGILDYDGEVWGVPDYFTNSGAFHASRIGASRALNGSHERVEAGTNPEMDPEKVTVPEDTEKKPWQPEKAIFNNDLSPLGKRSITEQLNAR